MSKKSKSKIVGFASADGSCICLGFEVSCLGRRCRVLDGDVSELMSVLARNNR